MSSSRPTRHGRRNSIDAVAIAREYPRGGALRAFPALDPDSPPRLVGVGGTVTTIAAVELGLRPESPDGRGPAPAADVLDPRLHGFHLSRAASEDVFRTLARQEPLADRIHNPGLPRDRAGSIVGGCCLLVSVLRRLKAAPGLTVSIHDALDAVVAELGATMTAPRPQASAPVIGVRRRSSRPRSRAVRIVRSRLRDPLFGRRVLLRPLTAADFAAWARSGCRNEDWLLQWEPTRDPGTPTSSRIVKPSPCAAAPASANASWAPATGSGSSSTASSPARSTSRRSSAARSRARTSATGSTRRKAGQRLHARGRRGARPVRVRGAPPPPPPDRHHPPQPGQPPGGGEAQSATRAWPIRYLEINGAWEDHVRYAITAEEWETRRDELARRPGSTEPPTLTAAASRSWPGRRRGAPEPRLVLIHTCGSISRSTAAQVVADVRHVGASSASRRCSAPVGGSPPGRHRLRRGHRGVIVTHRYTRPTRSASAPSST